MGGGGGGMTKKIWAALFSEVTTAISRKVGGGGADAFPGSYGTALSFEKLNKVISDFKHLSSEYRKLRFQKNPRFSNIHVIHL